MKRIITLMLGVSIVLMILSPVMATETVVFFDDFETGNINAWKPRPGINPLSVTNQTSYSGTYSVHALTDICDMNIEFASINTGKVIAEAYIKQSGSEPNSAAVIAIGDSFQNYPNAHDEVVMGFISNVYRNIQYATSTHYRTDGVIIGIPTTVSYTYDTDVWYKLKIEHDFTDSTTKFYVNDELITEVYHEVSAIGYLWIGDVGSCSGMGNCSAESIANNFFIDDVKLTHITTDEGNCDGEMFYDDFEMGNLDKWTIGGRQQGYNNIAEVIDVGEDLVAHLHHESFTEITIENTYDYDPNLTFAFDMKTKVSSQASSTSSFYAMAGVVFRFYDNLDQAIGHVLYYASTSSWRFNRPTDPPYIEYIRLPNDDGFHSYSLNIQDIISNIEIDENSISKVKILFQPYASGWPYNMIADVWVDNVIISTPSCEPDINIDPLEYNFGAVEVGTSSTMYVNIANAGNSKLIIDSIDFEYGIFNDSFTANIPSMPLEIGANSSVDILVNYSPTILYSTDVNALVIKSNDPDNSVIEVLLTGHSVLSSQPTQAISSINDLIDQAIIEDTLIPSENGNSGTNKTDTFKGNLLSAGSLIQNDLEIACDQLSGLYLKVDGDSSPKDWFSGEGQVDIARAIATLMMDIKCPKSPHFVGEYDHALVFSMPYSPEGNKGLKDFFEHGAEAAISEVVFHHIPFVGWPLAIYSFFNYFDEMQDPIHVIRHDLGDNNFAASVYLDFIGVKASEHPEIFQNRFCNDLTLQIGATSTLYGIPYIELTPEPLPLLSVDELNELSEELDRSYLVVPKMTFNANELFTGVDLGGYPYCMGGPTFNLTMTSKSKLLIDTLGTSICDENISDGEYIPYQCD